MSLLLMITLTGCIRTKDKPQKAYYLKAGEPAPIEGWLLDKSTTYDLMMDALKNNRDR